MKYIYGSFHVKRLGLFALGSRRNLHPETIRVTEVKGQGASLGKIKQNIEVFFPLVPVWVGHFADLRCPGSELCCLTGKTVPSGHHILLNFIHLFINFFDVDRF